MTKGKKPKKNKENTFYKEKPDPPKPTIPNDILMDFLEKKIKISEVKNITNIKDSFLWGENIQRYRINVWVAKEVEGLYWPVNSIEHSWFVHYIKEDKKIVDKTVQPKPKKERIF